LSHIVAGAVDCAFMVQIGQALLSDYVVVFFIRPFSAIWWEGRRWSHR
jgi:hypothetical protein